MRRAAAHAVMLLLIGLLAGAAVAMAVAWRSDPLAPSRAYWTVSCVQVTMLREGQTWRVEHVGKPGTNPNFDPDDPDRRLVPFWIGGDARGDQARPWYGRWVVSLAPFGAVRQLDGSWARAAPVPPSAGKVDLLRDLAREAVSDAIRAGTWPWPRALAGADSGTSWRPLEQLRRGGERARWIIAIPSAAAIAGALLLIRARKNLGPGRCRRCGYPIQGLATPVCPECGTASSPASKRQPS